MSVPEAGALVAGRYRLVRELGRGAMGVVFEAEHVVTGDVHALKLIPERTTDAKVEARFAQEARAASGLSSPHLVRVTDAGRDEGLRCFYLVMELLQGMDLQALVKERGRLPPALVVALLEQAAVGLDAVHASRDGLVHRDLKPENLYLETSRGGAPIVKLLDFGIAKAVGPEAIAQTATLVGTPMYMAPEQLRGTVTRACDLYALGQIAFTLLVGVPYFEPERVSAGSVGDFLLKRIQPGGPASARAALAGVVLPAAFDGWFARATHEGPAGRFPSAKEAIAALAVALAVGRPVSLADELAAHGPGHTQPLPAAPTPSSSLGSLPVSVQTAQEAPRRRGWRTVGLLAVCGGGALAYALAGRSEPGASSRRVERDRPRAEVPAPSAPSAAPPVVAPVSASAVSATGSGGLEPTGNRSRGAGPAGPGTARVSAPPPPRQTPQPASTPKWDPGF